MINKTDSIQLIGDGDSLTFGTDGRMMQDYILRLYNLMLSNGFTDLIYSSYGVSGRTTKQLIDEWDTKVKPNIDLSRKSVLVIMEDINAILNFETKGILGAKTGRENYEDMANYITQAKSDGVDYVVLVTGFYPRKVGGVYNQVFWTEDRLLFQENYFDLANQEKIEGVDVVVDLRNSKELGGARSQPYNPLYFDDSVHCNGVGYNLMGDFVYKNGIKEITK